MRCPACNDSDEFKIDGAYQNYRKIYLNSELEITDYKTGDIEWDDHAQTYCMECGYEGTYDTFLGEDNEDNRE